LICADGHERLANGRRLDLKIDTRVFIFHAAQAHNAPTHPSSGVPTMKAEIKRLVTPGNAGHGLFAPGRGKTLRIVFLLLLFLGLSALITTGRAIAQRGNLTLWGDVRVSESKENPSATPLSLTILLYRVNEARLVGRQTVPSRGRYRFTNLEPDDYEVIVEVENTEGLSNEVARVRINVGGSSTSDFRQDFEFELKSRKTAPKSTVGTISAADLYDRPALSKPLFRKAQEAVEKKKYDQAEALLKQILDGDKLDFQVWTLLGSVYLVQEKFAEAEKAYLGAIEAKPKYSLALLHLGKLRGSQKRFEEAIDPLTRVVELQPQSAEANYLLGEAYLQIKKGSKAVPYLNDAARLGRPEAHLRLAWLYNAAGMKDKAAIEYEEFLKKKPDYAERKKLQEYISANKKG
jgi:tetratricopeptide (TPR) repeat protein